MHQNFVHASELVCRDPQLPRSAKDLVPQTELRDKITDFCKKHGIVMGNESATALEHPEIGELGEQAGPSHMGTI